jgi:hypothetical protein
MTWRRAAAICLLVFCLSVSAILHSASQAYPDVSSPQLPQPGISAPSAEFALVLANKIENPSAPELTPAVFGHLNFLRLFGGNGSLRHLPDDHFRPSSVESAIEIRGPPHSVSG